MSELGWLLLVGTVAVVVYLMREAAHARDARSWQQEPAQGDEDTWTSPPTRVGDRSMGATAAGRAPSNSEECWVPPGEAVRVSGFTLPDGMVYVGSGLPAISEWHGTEPALVDPSCSVAKQARDWDGEHLHYWPSYGDVPPSSRAAYLAWLATGRSRPGINIGYVFLFFYGIERRLLHDARTSARARAEAPALLAEVERLLEIYGENGSFRGYASDFLQFSRLTLGDLPGAGESPDLSSGIMPGAGTVVDIVVGKQVAEGRPIPASWALAWWATARDTRMRTPARRCWDLFVELFGLRYGAQYGEGMRLKPNKSPLRCSYRPASASFRGEASVDIPGVSDIRRLSRPVRQLDAIAEACTNELDPYSRWLGRRKETTDALPGLALLPADLLDRHEPPELKPLNRWLESRMDSEQAVAIEVADVMERWPCSREDKLLKREAVGFAQLLEKLGIGIEPDVRFGGSAWKLGGRLVLFPLGGDYCGAPTSEYASATTVLHLAALVAAADEVIDESEEGQIEAHLERSMRLAEGERIRLRAHLAWLLDEKPTFSGLKKRLEGLAEPQKDAVAALAVGVAGADGVIAPEEVRVLKRIYGMLGREEAQLYDCLHDLGAAADKGPVLVRDASAPPRGYAIPEPDAPRRPEPTEAPEPGFRLDVARVEEKLAETTEVSHLLAAIFVDDDDEAPEPDAAQAMSDDPALSGLDSAHSALVRELAGRESVERVTFESLADSLGLLPDGALDVINDAAFEVADEPLFEGDDPLEINAEVLEEMTQ